jgi:CBS domain containing-hemolysin-like protein
MLVLVAATASLLRPVYGVSSLKELKRRASKGDQVAAVLYQVARHGGTADIFLFLLAVILSAAASVLIARHLALFWAITVTAALLVLIFSILPKRTSKFGHKIALRLSPYLAKVLVKIRPSTNWLARVLRRNKSVQNHTGIYEKEDLIELMNKQQAATHNRIEKTELELAKSVLQFGDKKVHDYMVPRRAVRFVHALDPIGPILLSELHDSGFSRFPVRDDTESIVGTLYLRDLVEKHTQGIVSRAMSPDVFYVRDDVPLERVLAAFLKTKHHLFMVVNEFEEIVGIITIEDVLEQILGRKIVDESDRFDDMRAVAKNQAVQEPHPDATEA